MADLRHGLDRASRRHELRPGAFERFDRRRRRRSAMQRATAGALAVAIAGTGIWIAYTAFRPGEVQRAARVTLRVDIAGRPGPLAVGFGSVWVADSQRRFVSRIDAETGTLESRIALPRRLGAPVSIETTPDGVWVQTGVLETRPPVAPAIVRIDPATDDAAVRFALGTGEHAEVAVAFASVWSANRDTGVVVRRDPRTGRILARFRAPRSALTISTGAGSVWVLSKGTHDAYPPSPATVTGIDPIENEVAARVVVDGRPTAIAAHGGAVWVVDAEGGAVTRIDPNAARVAGRVSVDGTPTTIAADDEGVWVGTLEGTLSRIDPATSDVVAAVDASSDIGGIAVADGTVWAASPSDGEVVRVDEGSA